MKTIHMFLGLSVLTLLLFLVGACATSTQSATKPAELASAAAPAPSAQAADHDHGAEDGVNRIKPADAVLEVKAGKALLVDVRDASSYETMHAKGAINVTYQSISEGKYDSLPKDKHLIFYCT